MLQIIIAVLLSLGMSGCGTSVEVPQAPASTEIVTPAPAPIGNQITPENYDKIQNGMTYEEVVEIFGKEGNKELNPPHNGYQLYDWIYSEMDFKTGKGIIYKVQVGFQDGKVCGKSYQDHL